MRHELNPSTEVIVNAKLEGKTYREVTPEMFNNRQLGKMVKWFAGCEIRINNDQWKAASYMAQMATVDAIKKDFGSDQAFADFMDMSRSDVNKLKRVARLEDVAKNHGLTVSKAYELLPLLGVDISIAQLLIDNNVDAKTTQKELREIVKNAKLAIEEVETEEVETEEVETEEVETEEVETEEVETEEVELSTDYTLPYTDDNGDIKESNFHLTEKQITLLAKAVDKILFNIR